MEKVMQGWFQTYWPKFKKAVDKSVRRSQDARDRAARIERRLARSFTAKVFLFRQQKGICPYCRQAIIWGKGWSIHHIFPKSQGGSDKLANLQLLHVDCHRQLHADLPVSAQHNQGKAK